MIDLRWHQTEYVSEYYDDKYEQWVKHSHTSKPKLQYKQENGDWKDVEIITSIVDNRKLND